MKHGRIRQDSSRYYFDTYTIHGLQPVIAYKHNYMPDNDYAVLTNKRYNVIDQVNTFDIETTSVKSVKPFSFMYHWQFCLGGTVIFGRKWEQFLNFYNRIVDYYNVSGERRLIIYVHNLSFEFQFIKSFFKWDDVFLTKERTVLRAVTEEGVEFRCSYILSNQSLELFTENMHVEHRKVKGEIIDEDEGMIFDYEKYRTPFDDMNWKELAYFYNDVMGLYEGINEQLKMEEDTLITVPMTSTGYVRRDVSAAVKSSKYMRNLKRILPNEHLYRLLDSAFRGGDTHANYLLAGKTLREIQAWDIVSSYPYVIMARRFPMSAFMQGDIEDIAMYLKEDKAMLMTVRFTNLSIKDIWDMPYISYSKCITTLEAKCDNGRVLSAKEITCCLTEVDYKIIMDCYSIERIEASEVWIADKAWLPPGIRETVMKYFTLKSELGYRRDELKRKRKEKGLSEDEEEELTLLSKNYMKSKNKLNAIYGMFATKPVRDEYSFNGITVTKKKAEVDKAIAEYNSKWSTFLAYQWGVWVTAYARERLWEIRNLKKGTTIYNDTDSCYWPKGLGYLINKYNEKVKEEILKSPIPPICHVKERTYYMGIVELDGEYDEFITWGAKRYAVKKNGKIKVTVSGLGKEVGRKALEKDGFENFKPGWTVDKCGNLTSYYNDEESHYIKIDGKKVLTGSNVALFPSSYTLNLTRDYNDLIGFIKKNL